MIVPSFWAEAKRISQLKGRQVTIRRFGWSETSEEDAQLMAERRADDALQQLLSGQPTQRRERRVAYNGADGLPIREEVLERHGRHVVTRNAYGAHCLNTPDCLIADVDFNTSPSSLLLTIVFSLAIVAGLWLGSLMVMMIWRLIFLLAALIISYPIATALQQMVTGWRGGQQQLTIERITRFLEKNPDWNVRVYQTAAGLRLIVTHATFQTDSDDVAEFFHETQSDPWYVRMCLAQNCFRARLTAKPWRIGIRSHMRPRPGVWPVHPERRAVRSAWIDRYEARAAQYASCRFLMSLGSGIIDSHLRELVDLHDERCRALSTDRPLG